MKTSTLSAFVVNLIQDVNVLRPLIYLASDDLGCCPVVMATNGFRKRDKSGFWQNEILALAEATGGFVYTIDSLYEYWCIVNQYKSGFIISASETDLGAHAETHQLFLVSPPQITTIVLQHGFECVGFLMNENHRKVYGDSVGFAADIICGWVPSHLQRNLRPLQRSRYIDAGPTAWIDQSSKRQLRNLDSEKYNEADGIVCENLHSVRHDSTNGRDIFMDQFFDFAEMFRLEGKKIALRPHPGGQYVLKNKISLPDHVIIDNRPSYSVDWHNYSFGISAPSSVIFDFLFNNVPTMIWQDPAASIDITQLAFLPIAQSAADMKSFADYPQKLCLHGLPQQVAAVMRNPSIVKNNYIGLMQSLLDSGDKSLKTELLNRYGEDKEARLQKVRVLLVAPAILPTLTISFIKPFGQMDKTVEYHLLTDIDHNSRASPTGVSRKELIRASCNDILSSFQPDIVVFCRYSAKDGLVLAEICRKKGIKIIYHIDDLLYAPSQDVLEEAKYNAYTKRAPTISGLIAKADLVYCSTEALAKRISSRFNNRTISGKIYKSVDPSAITYNQHREKVIGYTGFGHTQDLESIEEALITILKRHRDWKLELIGTMVPSQRILDLGDQGVLIDPEKDYDSYISLLISRSWSIGICPLINNSFNSFKANTKWVEYSFCNIATVASKVESVYASCADGCGILCSSINDWENALESLIQSPEAIDRLVLNSQGKLRREYSDNHLKNQLHKIFYGLIDATKP